MARLFCFGFGYSARVLATRLATRNFEIAGTCRTGEKAAALRSDGIAAWTFDDSHPLQDPASAFRGTTHMLVSIPPGDAGDPVLVHHTRDILDVAGSLCWIGYLSTTGVYGDRQGGWVDEESELRPGTERGKRRAEAERGWLGLHAAHRLPVHIFRLAGIYGPGRNQLESVQSGSARRIVKKDQVFSRVHVDDIANVLEASIAHPDPGTVYNVCDDAPAPPQDVVSYAARLLGVEPPPEIPFEEAELSPMARSFYADSKRVSNRRIKEKLGVKLTYPTYREGLKALANSL